MFFKTMFGVKGCQVLLQIRSCETQNNYWIALETVLFMGLGIIYLLLLNILYEIVTIDGP